MTEISLVCYNFCVKQHTKSAETTSPKAAGYVRVSTNTQVENGQGLSIQRAAIEQYCATAGLVLLGFFEDAGVSGANGIGQREGWLQLIEGLREGKFSVVVISRLDRLARDLMLQESMLADVRRLGGELVSIGEPDLCSEDHSRVLFRQIKGAISQYEKAMIVARLQAGRLAKRRLGGYIGGSVIPLGLRVQGEGSEAMLVPDEQVGTVRRIFQAYLGGVSMKKIADRLTSDGIPTKRGGHWTQQQVSDILHNEVYQWTDVIDEQTFTQAREKIGGTPTAKVAARKRAASPREGSAQHRHISS